MTLTKRQPNPPPPTEQELPALCDGCGLKKHGDIPCPINLLRRQAVYFRRMADEIEVAAARMLEVAKTADGTLDDILMVLSVEARRDPELAAALREIGERRKGQPGALEVQERQEVQTHTQQPPRPSQGRSSAPEGNGEARVGSNVGGPDRLKNAHQGVDDPPPDPPPSAQALTQNQLRAIYAIGRAARKLEGADLEGYCVDMFGVKPKELTKSEAHTFIDHLKGGRP